MQPGAACIGERTWAAVHSLTERSSTSVPCFVDTNILVYAEDRDAGAKHERARELVLERWNEQDGVISIQVLQEFFVTVTRKMKSPLLASQASRIVQQYFTWTVVDNTRDLLLQGIRLADSACLSFWDALIVSAAIRADCEILYTEDLNPGQEFGEVRIVNPLSK